MELEHDRDDGEAEEGGEELDTPEGEDVDDLEDIIAQLGPAASDMRMVVYKVRANADPEECIDCPASMFVKAQLLEDYGPGVYKAEIRNRGKIHRRIMLRFAAPLRSAVAVPAASASNDRVRELELQLQQQRERAEQRNHELMLQLAGRESKAPNLGDLMGTLLQAKEVLGLGGNGGGFKDMLSTFRDFVALRTELGDGGGKETTGFDVAREALPMLGQLIEAAKVQEGAQPNPRARLTAPSAGGTASSTPKAAPSKRAQMIAMVLEHARANTPPAMAAQFAWGEMQKLDDDTFDALCSALESDGALRLALMLEPRLETAQEWLAQVLGELRPLILAAEGGEGLTGDDDDNEAPRQPN